MGAGEGSIQRHKRLKILLARSSRPQNARASMPAITVPLSEGHRPRRSIVIRVASIILLAFVIGWTLNLISRRLDRGPRPAGFARGLVQGAMMPAAMPNLLIGYDVAIYSANNNGIFYKLGYTMGVNACGAIFFGAFYWRVSRWGRVQ